MACLQGQRINDVLHRLCRKTFSDEIEAIEMGPVDAMRAAGANSFQVFLFAVVPQVRVAFTGIAIYTWDVAFRRPLLLAFLVEAVWVGI